VLRNVVLTAALTLVGSTVTRLGRAGGKRAGGSMAKPKHFGSGEVEFISHYLWDKRVPGELHMQFGAARKPARAQAPCRKIKVTPIPAEEDHPAAGYANH